MRRFVTVIGVGTPTRYECAPVSCRRGLCALGARLHGWLHSTLDKSRSLLAIAMLSLAFAGCTTLEAPPVGSPSEAGSDDANLTPHAPDSSTGPALVIVVDDPGHDTLEMRQVFSARLGRPYQILNLAHRSRESVTAALRALAPIEAVVLGRRAYEIAAAVRGLDVFYAWVLDPQETTQGVDALPPFSVQLDYWQSLAPEVRRLGVIGGSGMATRVEDLARECRARGLVLEQRQVNSDIETLLAFRSMVPHIDGFVFLPDESVLSPRVIQQVMTHGRRNEVQILVYSPVMFKLGASLYVQSDPVQVASALVALLDDPKSRPEVAAIRTKTRLRRPLELSAADSVVGKAGF